ncbi:hypothetical protein [Arcticibacter eurypsychrophilus]|uniref:hypothetical protein n=1 Tax=Arcticibacter eurypsychrophilus TaxID=1434752 RepID=UPI00084DA75B|nr:hypothetical protein [Arcticibacter eurypsychrophilus]
MKIFSILFLSSSIIVFICALGQVPANSDYELHTLAASVIIFITVGYYVSKYLSRIAAIKVKPGNQVPIQTNSPRLNKYRNLFKI